MSYATRLAQAYQNAANNYAESLAVANEALNEMKHLIAELNAMDDSEISDGPVSSAFLPVIR